MWQSNWLLFQDSVVAAGLRSVLLPGWDRRVALLRLAANGVWSLADFAWMRLQPTAKPALISLSPSLPVWCCKNNLQLLLLVRDDAGHEVFHALEAGGGVPLHKSFTNSLFFG